MVLTDTQHCTYSKQSSGRFGAVNPDPRGAPHWTALCSCPEASCVSVLEPEGLTQGSTIGGQATNMGLIQGMAGHHQKGKTTTCARGSEQGPTFLQGQTAPDNTALGHQMSGVMELRWGFWPMFVRVCARVCVCVCAS